MQVTKDGQILVVVNHAGNKSALYTSDRVTPHTAEFSLSLDNIMYYRPQLTWRQSWLESVGDAQPDNNFVDLYAVAGLRGVYIASTVAEGVAESAIRPTNLTTLITFDGGAEWSKVEGPRNDTNGHPIPGCYEVSVNVSCVTSYHYIIANFNDVPVSENFSQNNYFHNYNNTFSRGPQSNPNSRSVH